MKGTVDFFHRGWGFITGENGAGYFVHQTSIIVPGFRKLYAGQAVEFDPDTDNMGRLSAINVKPCESSREEGEDQ